MYDGSCFGVIVCVVVIVLMNCVVFWWYEMFDFLVESGFDELLVVLSVDVWVWIWCSDVVVMVDVGVVELRYGLWLLV